MPDAFLKVDALSAGYGDVQVLWDIAFEVAAGEIVCIVGSNGAGKTTLLRTISGIVRATGGAVTLAGEDLTNIGPDRVLGAGIAHVPEGRRLFKGLSVRDNLLLGAYLRTDKPAIRHDLDHVLELFPVLRERLAQDATTLSGGEQQMCAIGRGIMARPRLLMIDELSLGLAPHLVDRLGDALKAINAEGPAILLVEQDVMTALELAGRGIIIETGRVAGHGASRDLVNDPAIRKAYLGV